MSEPVKKERKKERKDYFVTDSPAHSPGNVWRGSDFSPDIWLFPKERRMLRKRDYQGRLSFHFFDRWMTDLATHRQKKVQAMSWKNLQMLEFCLFTWSWMGPINCAPNPIREKVKKTKIFVKQSFFIEFRWNFAHRSGTKIEIIWNYFWKKFKFKF